MLNDLAREGDVDGVRAWIFSHNQTDNADKIRAMKQNSFMIAVNVGHVDVVRVFMKEGGVSADTRSSDRVREKCMFNRFQYVNI